MHRRTFIASAVPPLVRSGIAAQTPRSAPAFVVPSDADRHGHGLVLAGRTPTHRKISTQDSAGALVLLEHRDMGRGGPVRHVHFEQDEWFYGIKWEFAVEVGGEVFRLNPGDLVFAPRNVPHTWACVSDMPGTILIGLYPALIFERFLERLGALAQPLEGDPLAKLFADHEMKVVGPPLQLR
jgi:mannose-6-phosphate isomerase-like protein (cupin superfamily)